MAFLACGALAQSKISDSRPTNVKSAKTRPEVVKTVSVESTAYKPFIATAYSLMGKMANGQNVHQGAIAGDPRILPLGTVVHIEGMGTFTVKDTGGAIKGNRIDIWMPSTRNAKVFGRKKINVRIISRPVRRTTSTKS